MKNAKIGISKNVPHTYIQGGIRYYALLREIETTNAAGKKVSAVNLYIFDDEGYVWLQMTHATRSFVFQLGGGILHNRHVLKVDDPQWVFLPNVASDEWINGSADRGYAVEVIREALGLDFTYLTALMEADIGEEKAVEDAEIP